MALHRMKDLLRHAEASHYAVGYFEAFNMDAMLGVLDAAKKARSPVIIGFGGAFLSSGKRREKEDVYLFGAVAKQAAERSGVPCAVILNEADHEDMVYQGMQAGFNALMYQKPGEDFSDTLRITREICKVAHFVGWMWRAKWGFCRRRTSPRERGPWDRIRMSIRQSGSSVKPE